MNMLTFDKTELHRNHSTFIAEAVFAVEMVKADEQLEKQKMAKQLLDTLFPLESGSHEDVVSYEIDYRHVLAYFKNGEHSGLKRAKHFIAFLGDKCSPESILFRDESGTHVEVMIGSRRGTGSLELVEINDVQLETCTTFSRTEHAHASGIRHWVSLVQGDEQGRPRASSEDKEYTAKNGDDYTLNFSFAY
ncbi:malate synthase [Vibrio sp. 10N.286.49.C2]|uniref:malate synthase n=1 Tax=unclassified Vibrio TaxID=2614977 RepID=UPI000C81D37C|nr:MULTISPECIES: malate synthase [unclassified Vibrio]PMH26478.1 malate synthase [Vibrio sp. 10N.286.49.C2]PMH54798.1 malate synthase [Vibrio sp. 10N.286.49.B1]PMH83974.1 malate synthase [Vibrio sp. 10N.286.48.B7]